MPVNFENLTAENGVGFDAMNRGSIFFDKKEIYMNHVNLIGKMTSIPRYYEHQNGRRVAQFSLSTSETFLDDEGNTKHKNYKHRIAAWGRWVKVLEELAQVGLEIAIEGKLTTRFYLRNGEKRFISEVEVNDLVIL